MTASTESLGSVHNKPYTPVGGNHSIWSRKNKNSIDPYIDQGSNSKVGESRYRTIESTGKKSGSVMRSPEK